MKYHFWKFHFILFFKIAFTFFLVSILMVKFNFLIKKHFYTKSNLTQFHNNVLKVLQFIKSFFYIFIVKKLL